MKGSQDRNLDTGNRVEMAGQGCLQAFFLSLSAPQDHPSWDGTAHSRVDPLAQKLV